MTPVRWRRSRPRTRRGRWLRGAWTKTQASALFSISKDGVLSFRESPDYETPASGGTDNMYIVTVLATDNAYGIDVPSNGDAPSQATTKDGDGRR